MIIAFIFISYNYDKKRSKTINILFIGFFIFLAGALILKFVNNEILNLVVFFILNLLFFIICFKIKIKEAVIYSILLDAVMFGAEMIALFFSSYVMKFPTNAYKTNLATFYILTIISKIIYFAVTQFIAFIINKLKFKSNNSTRFIPLFIFPFISIAISVLFLRMSFVNNYDNRYNISFIILNVIMIIACIYVFIYYQRLAKSDAYLNELQTENKLLEINNDYIEVLKHQNNEMRMLFHDTKNHLNAIHNLNTNPEIDEYLNKMISNLKSYSSICHSGNHMLDVIISKYATECEIKNISFSFDVCVTNLKYVKNNDLVTILSNALDNAIEATEKSSNKTINFATDHINTYDVITITNSCDTPPKIKGNDLETTKKNKINHGLGIKSIQKVLKQYNGDCQWEYDKDKKKFTLMISLLSQN